MLFLRRASEVSSSYQAPGIAGALSVQHRAELCIFKMEKQGLQGTAYADDNTGCTWTYFSLETTNAPNSGEKMQCYKVFVLSFDTVSHNKFTK